MAEEQEEVQEQESNQAQKKSSNLVLIIVIVVLVFTLLIGGIIVALLLSGDDEMPVQQASQGQMMDESSYDGGGSQQVRQKATKRIESLDVGPMFPLDGFTINLLSDSGRRYLKTTINLELRDEESAEELEAKAPVIRDILIRVMTSKTLEEIATAKGKDKLKDQLVNQINLRLRDAEVKNIYFVEFVIQ
jgi:flagellar FliL protein